MTWPTREFQLRGSNNFDCLADLLCHRFVMKSPRRREKRMPRGSARPAGQPRAWPWRTSNRPSSWWRRSSNKRISSEHQSSNNSWLVKTKILQLQCRPFPFSNLPVVRIHTYDQNTSVWFCKESSAFIQETCWCGKYRCPGIHQAEVMIQYQDY